MTTIQAIEMIEFSEMTTETELIHAFASLIRSGIVWQLQGHYGRTAANLIEAGLITKEGKVTNKLQELCIE